jgi:hypothetical protein
MVQRRRLELVRRMVPPVRSWASLQECYRQTPAVAAVCPLAAGFMNT